MLAGKNIIFPPLFKKKWAGHGAEPHRSLVRGLEYSPGRWQYTAVNIANEQSKITYLIFSQIAIATCNNSQKSND
ncbi:MAG: hypothetical protein DBX61_08320 [Clostridiales bacterium]|nr:MAG: hypothetical protein DBX61_08320 [Clostridiales bacterium]